MRSKWKGYYVEKVIFQFIKSEDRAFEGNKWLFKKTSLRSSVFVDDLVGKVLFIHNGREHVDVVLPERYISYKIGQFVWTKEYPDPYTQTKIEKRKRQEKRQEKKKRQLQKQKIKKQQRAEKMKKDLLKREY